MYVCLAIRSPALYACVRIPPLRLSRTCVGGREGRVPRSNVHVHRPCYFYEWLTGYVIPTRATTACIRVTYNAGRRSIEN